ncbi:MAG: rhodanese-like domain-containing protein [Pirellula sp.]
MSPIRSLVASTALSFLLISVASAQEHTKDTLEKVKENVEAKKAMLVDVRDLGEWNNGHIKGAVHLPIRDLQDKYDEAKIRKEIPKGTIVYTYCVVGMRALKSSKYIEKAGFEVRPLKPGYDDLVKFGFVSEKPEKPEKPEKK